MNGFKMRLLTMRRFNCPFILVIVILISQQAYAVTNPSRSVKQCDPLQMLPQAGDLDRECSIYCTRTYVQTSAESLAANKHLAVYYIDGPSCCCLFNALWPEYVNTKAIGREHDHRNTGKEVADCLPLMFSINLSQKSKDSYETLCRYLSKREKLNILEMMRFAEAAYFLNYMKPKHPAIMKTIHKKEVKALNKEAIEQLRRVYNPQLLDTLRDDIKQYEGYQLDASGVKSLASVRESIKAAIRSRIVAEAFDELVISRALVDVQAASLRVQEVNLDLGIPESLLLGNYDKYNLKDKARYFTLPGIDCKYLRQTNRQVSSYVDGISWALSNLFEKLVYTHMSEKFKPLVGILESEKLYKNIIEVNCQQQGR